MWRVLHHLLIGIVGLGMTFAGANPIDAKEGGRMSIQKQHATGHTAVTSSSSTPFDQQADGPSLAENQLTETFTGDIEGEGIVRVIQAMRRDGSGTFVGLERVRGSIAGRTGTFLLQVTGTVAGKNKQMNARWFVVAGAGTGDLKDLRGDGGFTAELGKHGSIWLDYFFE